MPTAVHQGLLFVYPGKAENAEKVAIPGIDPLEEDPDGWVLLNTFRDLPYDALTLLENVLDASHIPYTHHETVGNRENAAPMQMDVLESGKQGFKGIWPEGPRKGKLGTQHTTFIAPSLMYHDLTSKQFGRTLTVVYAVPMRKGECRLFARFPFKFSSKIPSFFIKLTPRWYSHVGNNRVLEDDQIFLHIQERLLEKALAEQDMDINDLPIERVVAELVSARALWRSGRRWSSPSWRRTRLGGSTSLPEMLSVTSSRARMNVTYWRSTSPRSSTGSAGGSSSKKVS